MADEKLDPYSPEGLRELASMRVAVTGPYLIEIADKLEQQQSKLQALEKELAEVHGGPALTRAFRLERNEARARADHLNEKCSDLASRLEQSSKEYAELLVQEHETLNRCISLERDLRDRDQIIKLTAEESAKVIESQASRLNSAEGEVIGLGMQLGANRHCVEESLAMLRGVVNALSQFHPARPVVETIVSHLASCIPVVERPAPRTCPKSGKEVYACSYPLCGAISRSQCGFP